MTPHENLLAGPPATRLPDEPEPRGLLESGTDPAAVAAKFPTYSAAWADLADGAWGRQAVIESYAYARVGYHRGLDALRAAGWRGSGYVRWRHESNRGFLRALHSLELAAAAIGESDEEQRCALFLRQLDPEWGAPNP